MTTGERTPCSRGKIKRTDSWLTNRTSKLKRIFKPRVNSQGEKEQNPQTKAKPFVDIPEKNSKKKNIDRYAPNKTEKDEEPIPKRIMPSLNKLIEF